ncbi:MAG: hypothetical protein ACOCXT_02575, partial [Candidatus Dojkabacteria bacterium]
HTDYFLDLKTELLLTIQEQIAIQEEKLKQSQEDKEDIFLAILSLHGFYLERIINGFGIIHAHLHPNNITVEFVHRNIDDVHSIHPDSDNFTFNYREYLKNPAWWRPVVRATDLLGMDVVGTWEFSQAEIIFNDDLLGEDSTPVLNRFQAKMLGELS